MKEEEEHKDNKEKVTLNQEAIQICPICEKRRVVVWYSEITQLTKMFCLECGRFWKESEDTHEDPREYVDWKIRELDKKVQESVNNCYVIKFHQDEEDDYTKCIDQKNKQLDKEVEGIVKGAISKVIMASLASGIPCDPDSSDGIKYIESCLEKMKKEKK